MDKNKTLKSGHTYRNFRGDLRGPMDERQRGVFLDQFGILYHADGRQWDHVAGSTGNLNVEIVMNIGTLSARAWLDDDGKHVWVAHSCSGNQEETMLPYPTWSAPDGLNVAPSFCCA